MSHVRRLFRDGICWGAAILFAATALPFVALAALVFRPALLVAAAVAGAAVAVLYCVSSRFRGWMGRTIGILDAEPVTPQLRH